MVITTGHPTLTILNKTDWINYCTKCLQDVRRNNLRIPKIFEQLIPNTPDKLHPASSSFLKIFKGAEEFKEEKISEEVIGSKIHPPYR